MLAPFVLSGCGARKDDASTQIAAKVNKEEISIHQINYLLQRQVGLKPDQLDAVSRNTLDALVDQELAVQAATELRIDRDPSVLMAIEAARRDIVARAYADRIAENSQTPTAAEVRKYYASHPALFAQRRLYTLIDTAIDAKQSEVEPMRPALMTARSQIEIASLLRSAKVRFGTRQVTLGAEELPMESVDRMAALRDGQSHFIVGPIGSRIFTIVSAQSAPLSEDEARPVIERFLVLDSRRRLVEQQMKALRSVARIEYRGKFAQPASELDAAAAQGSQKNQTVPEPTTTSGAGPTLADGPVSGGTVSGSPVSASPVAGKKPGADTVALRKGAANLK